ncbi:MAG TPA: serine hydrolase domain-containing protein [Steroidobacteraceae bacterium]|jgi:D-alanyl-D-alanine carboxypeptidase|nr:serine hydrolase domain-containing protein [Steroidobacteraceae bacterium]
MRPFALLLAAAATMLAPRAAPASHPPVPQTSVRELQALLDRTVAADPSIPGVLLRIDAPRSGLHASLASGNIRRGAAQPLRPDQPFRIASVTKVFVAATAFRLMERGCFGLFDAIAPLLDPHSAGQLSAAGYRPDLITVQQLLAHTSGLYDYASDPAFIAQITRTPRKRWTREEQVAFAMSHGKPVGAPGERYAYSDTGYLVLAQIIERCGGGTLPAIVRRELAFDEHGLRSTYFESLEPAPAGAPPLAHQYMGEMDMLGVDASFDLYGGGGLVSTTADLNRFMAALLGGRIFEHPRTLDAALMTVDAKHSPADHLHANLLTTWGFGRRTCWGHRGFWGTEVLYCPDAEIRMSFTIDQAEPRDPAALDSLAAAVAAILEPPH